MPLTQLQITQAKPQEKLRKLSDGHGLQLWVEPDGAKRWRMAYRFDGKQKILALGVYPETGLKEARELREKARKLLADGLDPNQQRKLDKLVQAAERTNTFGTIAAEFVVKKRSEGRSEKTLSKIEWLLGHTKRDLGPRPVAEIKASEILAVLGEIEGKGNHETASRVRSTISEVFRLAVATGRAEVDPTSALKGALITPKVTHRAAIVDPVAYGKLLRAIDGYDGAPETLHALKLLALTFVRPGELRQAEWSEFDLDAGGLGDTWASHEDEKGTQGPADTSGGGAA